MRAPAVAGRFYPADRRTLLKELDSFLPKSHGAKTTPIAIMVPHAGYMYSGAVAGEAYARITVPPRVIILNPNHTGIGARVSVSEFDEWETPLGIACVDVELRTALLKKCPSAELDQDAHLREHAGEVQIPFLQRLKPHVKLLPITLGDLSVEDCRDVGEALAGIIQELISSGPILIVASSDMNHYEPSNVSKVKDELALDRILGMDPEGLYDVVQKKNISMCGVLPVTAALFAATALGGKQATLVRYANSGDVSGDYDAVVGYASVIIN